MYREASDFAADRQVITYIVVILLFVLKLVEFQGGEGLFCSGKAHSLSVMMKKQICEEEPGCLPKFRPYILLMPMRLK
ncbi:hypothetical protein ABIE27_000156 [Paenibacillus sp. 4624]